MSFSVISLLKSIHRNVLTIMKDTWWDDTSISLCWILAPFLSLIYFPFLSPSLFLLLTRILEFSEFTTALCFPHINCMCYLFPSYLNSVHFNVYKSYCQQRNAVIVHCMMYLLTSQYIKLMVMWRKKIWGGLVLFAK